LTPRSLCIALALELEARVYVAAEVLAAVEAMRADKPMPPIGAADSVAELVVKWPDSAKSAAND